MEELLCKSKMIVFPKSKKGGVVSDLVQGTGGLIVGVIIVLVIVSTLLGANLFSSDDRTATSISESVTGVDETGTTFGNSTLQGAVCSVATAVNQTGGVLIEAGNYTVTGCSIAFTSSSAADATKFNTTDWIVNSSTQYNGVSEYAVNDMNVNFTVGLNNISEKIPTILLLAAVILLFGVLVLLVAKSRDMGIGGGTSL